MGSHPAEHAAQANDTIAESGQATEKLLKRSSAALNESIKASNAAFKELTDVYQDVARKNIENLNAAMEALAEIKKPRDFVELQQRLIKESIEAAVNDGQRIARLVAVAYAAPFVSAAKRGETTPTSTQH